MSFTNNSLYYLPADTPRCFHILDNDTPKCTQPSYPHPHSRRPVRPSGPLWTPLFPFWDSRYFSHPRTGFWFAATQPTVHRRASPVSSIPGSVLDRRSVSSSTIYRWGWQTTSWQSGLPPPQQWSYGLHPDSQVQNRASVHPLSPCLWQGLTRLRYN